MDHVEGLRERKKRQTENAIELAGVRLAREHGHEAVTVAEICNQANISRSTFFNYMPSREAAIFGKPLNLIPYEQGSQILLDLNNEPIAKGLFRIVFASIGHSKVHPAVAEARSQLLAEQPETQPLILAPFTTLVTDLTTFLVTWFTRNPEGRSYPDKSLHREATLTVLLTVSALQIMLFEIDGDQDVTLSEEQFDEAISQLADIADASHG